MVGASGCPGKLLMLERRENMAAGGPETARWLIELGATHETELRIVPTSDEADLGRLVMVRPTYDYRIGTTGLELRATFRLDVRRHPLRDLTLQVDPELRVAAVQLSGNPVGSAPIPVDADQHRHFSLNLPTSLVSGPHELTVTAYAPVIMNQPWRLPKLRLVDVQWRQGNASIDIVEPLQIGQLDWKGSTLRGADPLHVGHAVPIHHQPLHPWDDRRHGAHHTRRIRRRARGGATLRPCGT